MGRTTGRESAQKRAAQPRPSLKKVNIMFADIEDNSVMHSVDPRACIPLTNPRTISTSGLNRLEHSFTDGSQTSTTSPGYSAAGGKAVVIRLEGAFAHYPKTYFTEVKCMAASEIDILMKETSEWFGVVDGHHRLLVIQRLIERRPEQWCGFQWNVLLIQPAPLEKLRAYARARNALQEDTFIVKTSVYDIMKALKDDANTLIREKSLDKENLPKGFISDVADLYAGGKGRSTNTQKQLAGCVIRLSDAVMDTIRDIVNG